ncbi:MAG TPA: MarR family transcriptional regulator [Desulfobacteria bacterium]|nr:MarR family transcriptional regulator [Desulfobacteria bacterium]
MSTNKKEVRSFGIHLSIILRRGQMYLDRKLEPLDVRSGQIPILRLLGIKDGINQENIRKFLHLDKGTVAKTIKPLILKGYVTRKTDPRDKRAYQIFLTRKGHEIMPDVNGAIAVWTEALTADFTEKEKDTAHDLLSRMSKNARTHLKHYGSESNGKA